LAGEARRDVLGRDHGGAALAVVGVGFGDPRSSRGLLETPGPVPAGPAERAGPGVVSAAGQPRRRAGNRGAALTRHVRSVVVRAARNATQNGQESSSEAFRKAPGLRKPLPGSSLIGAGSVEGLDREVAEPDRGAFRLPADGALRGVGPGPPRDLDAVDLD